MIGGNRRVLKRQLLMDRNGVMFVGVVATWWSTSDMSEFGVGERGKERSSGDFSYIPSLLQKLFYALRSVHLAGR